MKKTAVEWLQEQLECFGNKHELQMSWATVNELFKQAKEMEKEQIINAYELGSESGYELAKNDDFVEGFKVKEAKEYYNETYKSE